MTQWKSLNSGRSKLISYYCYNFILFCRACIKCKGIKLSRKLTKAVPLLWNQSDQVWTYCNWHSFGLKWCKLKKIWTPIWIRWIVNNLGHFYCIAHAVLGRPKEVPCTSWLSNKFRQNKLASCRWTHSRTQSPKKPLCCCTDKEILICMRLGIHKGPQAKT
jgi:hypothetical protein